MKSQDKSEMTYQEFKDRQQYITLDEIVHIPVDIAYTDTGKGTPLILLHGIPTWSYLYHNVIDELAKDYRVIAPDFLGHGYSDQRDLFDRSIQIQAKMVKRLMQHLQLQKAHIIGHDTGGGVSLILAIEHPELVDKLVGICAPYIHEEGKISLIRNAASLNTNHTVQLVNRHKSIKAETLVLWGVDDPWQTITDGRRLAREIPKAHLIELSETSHWLQQDNPEDYLAHLLAFLK